MLKRAKGLLLFGLVIMCLLGAVPTKGNEGERAHAQAKPVVLSLWQTEILDYTPALQNYSDVVDSSVTVNVQTVPIANFEKKLKLAIATGNVPDLILMPNWLLPNFSAVSDAFVDLNEIDTEYVATLKSTLAKGVWGTVNPPQRETVSFIPLNSSPTVWYYRADLFRQAGLPSDPTAVAAKLKTWDAVAAAGKTFKSKTKKPLFGQPEAIFEAILMQKGPVFYDAKGAYIGDKNSQLKKAYDYVVKGLKEGWIGRYESNTPVIKKAVKAGSFGSLIGYHNMVTSIQQKLAGGGPGKWAVAPMPEKSPDSGVLSAAISASSVNSDAALDVIGWLTNQGLQSWAYVELGFFPANVKSIAEKEWLDQTASYFGKQKVNKTLAQVTINAKSYPLYQEPSPPPEAYNNALLRVIRNPKADPAKEWATAVKEAKASAALR